jgi:hypothetical protein
VSALYPLFAYWAIWERNPSDFSSEVEYSKWLQALDHPLPSARLQRFGDRLLSAPQAFFPGQEIASSKVADMRSTGRALVQAARDMEEFEGRGDARRLERFDLSRLDVSKQVKPLVVAKKDTSEPQSDPATVIRRGHARRLDDIEGGSDLLKLSGSWWGETLGTLPAIAGLKEGHFQVADDPDPAQTGRKILHPLATASESLWSPPELEPFAFYFDDQLGLVEISGFLGAKTEDAYLKTLTDRYGEPTSEVEVLGFVSYSWEYDQSVLSLNFMSFAIRPNLAVRSP